MKPNRIALALILSVAAVLPAAVRADPVLQVEITHKGFFSKPETISIPLPPDGTPGVVRSEIEQPFFSCAKHESKKEGGTVDFYTSTQVGFGVTIKAAYAGVETASVSLTDTRMLGVCTSPDGMQTAPSTRTVASTYVVGTTPVVLHNFGEYKLVRMSVVGATKTCTLVLENRTPGEEVRAFSSGAQVAHVGPGLKSLISCSVGTRIEIQRKPLGAGDWLSVYSLTLDEDQRIEVD